MCWGPPGWIFALKGRGRWVCTAVGPGPLAAQGVPKAGMGAQHRARPEEAPPAGGWGAGRILVFVTTFATAWTSSLGDITPSRFVMGR